MQQTLPPVALTQVNVISWGGQPGRGAVGPQHWTRQWRKVCSAILKLPPPYPPHLPTTLPFLSYQKSPKPAIETPGLMTPAPHSVCPTLAPSAHTLPILLSADPEVQDLALKAGIQTSDGSWPGGSGLMLHSAPLWFLRRESCVTLRMPGWGGEAVGQGAAHKDKENRAAGAAR